MPADREQIWRDAFNAYASASLVPSVAAEKAEQSLKLYEQRWSGKAAPSVQHLGASSSVSRESLAAALTKLEEGGRTDSRNVLIDLLAALESGKDLYDWVPGPRRG